MKLGETVPFTVLVFLAVTLSKVHGQALPPNGELPIELRARLVPNSSAIDLIVPKSDTAGVVELYGAGEVEDLFRRPSTLQFTNAPASGDLLWRVPAEQRAFYRALLRSGVSLADYAMPDWNESADPTNQVALMVWGIPETLKTGAPLSASFLLVKSDGDVAPLAPSGKLKVLSWETGLPHPDATVVPETLTFTNGHAAAQVVITAATSLEGYTLGIQWEGNTPVWPSGGIRKAGLSGGADGSFVLPASRFDSLFDVEALASTPGALSKAWRDFMLSTYDLQTFWGLPLAFPAAVTGSFGEWRGHIRNGPHDNVHAGLDLKANTGDIVVASRGGYIIKNNGEADGRYVTINHLDGTYSRYLHLQPWGKNDAKLGPVKRGQRLGLVGTPGGGPHLHFEIRRHANALIMDQGMPGVGVDPVREPGLFPVGGLNNLPILGAFQVSGEHPASKFIPYAGDTSGSPAAGGKAYVIVKLYQKRLDGEGGGLTPKAVQMEWEGGGGPVGFDLKDETAVKQAKPTNSIGSRAGFAIYEHGHATTAKPFEFFRFWFEWDTLAYASDPSGPRKLTLKSQSYSTNSSLSEWQLKWGPEIETLEPVGEVAADGTREYQVKVKYWRGHPVGGGAEPALKGHDWYEYELSEGGVWIADGTILGGSAKTKDTNGTVATRELHFKMPADQASKGWVKVSSGRVSDISHRRSITPGPLRILIRSGQNSLSTIDPNVAINSSGVVAFTGTDPSGSHPYLIREGGSLVQLGFPGSPNRNFAGIGISEGLEPAVLVRERVSGAPPGFLIRRWDSKSNTGTILGSSVTSSGPADFDSAASMLDMNASGTVVAPVLIGGSLATAVLHGNQRPLTQAAILIGAQPLRPQISSSGLVVLRDQLGRILTLNAGGVVDVVASSASSFADDTGNRPGISDDGSTVAWSGNRGGGPGVYVAAKFAGKTLILAVAGGELKDGFGSFQSEQRVGVQVSTNGQSRLITIVFQGALKGADGVYKAEVLLRPDGSVGRSPVEAIVKKGDIIESSMISGYTLYRPLSDSMKIAFVVSLPDGQSAIVKR